MKIALAQINSKIADLKGNTKKILHYYQKAKSQNADIVIFPELALTGYPPLDLLENSDFIDKELSYLKSIAKEIESLACVLGYVDINENLKGKKLKNSAAFIHKRKIIKINKSLLPTYDIFDEARYFEPSLKNNPIVYKGEKIGITICEDIWADTELLPDRFLYKFNPLENLIRKGVKTIINISASPFEKNKNYKKIKILSEIAKKNKIRIIYVNSVGANDELIFDGRSFILDEKGKINILMKDFEEDFYVFDTEKDISKFTLKKDQEIEEIYKAIICGIRDYFEKQNFSKAIIGLSGGIDSAVVACLAVKAIGNENVLGVMMPSRYTSEESINSVNELAQNLKIKILNLPIDEIYKSYLKTLSLNYKEIDITLQNIQSRIRGNLLMALSNKTGGLVLVTGNKSEISMGYCTLYGDTAGAIAPIGDVLKTDVYKIAEFINKEQKIIPEFIIKRAPTAELKPGQKDQDDLPPYEILDEIIKMYIEENIPISKISKKFKDKNYVTSIIKRIEKNEYKRKQLPMCFKISAKSFGSGRKMPIVKDLEFM